MTESVAQDAQAAGLARGVAKREISGWLLDVYAAPFHDGEHSPGIALWLLGEDGQRYHLHQPFPVTFYAAGPAPRLRELWRFLSSRSRPPRLRRSARRDLFAGTEIDVLEVECAHPAVQQNLFHQASTAFPELTYYDTDIPLSLRFAARYGVFPLAYCQTSIDEQGNLYQIASQDSPWDLDFSPPPIRILTLKPDSEPAHAEPRHIEVRCERSSYRLSLEHPRPLLINLRAILSRHDPDLVLTNWGDTWLLPRLISLSQDWKIPLPLNRDPEHEISYRRERTYFSYGQVIYRGQQVHLFGRWHVDAQNAIFYTEYGLPGIFELARVTALPVQTVARVSPGTGISSMQVLTALHQGVLVPWHKQEAEHLKTALDLIHADQGGMVYQPIVGLHRDVAEIDFMSMYPSIMAHFNISPETVGTQRPTAVTAPELGLVVDQAQPGLVPQTLAPLLNKRLSLKARMLEIPAYDPRRKLYKAYTTAHKWLLVTCFGYLGYKNARFGRIEAHEAVTAYGREVLLRAKETAEEMGFTVLHMYVDGLWVQRPGASTPADFQPLLETILDRTRLPVALDGIYRWVAFLPSRVDPRLPVPNRYFGVFQDGSLKMRGIEARRGDSPAFVAETQVQIIEHLTRIPTGALADRGRQALAPVIALLRRRIADLRSRRLQVESLIVSQKLSRELEAYHTPSPAARAAAQLEAIGKHTRPGQRVHFLYTLGEPGVYAWDLLEPPDPASLDYARYTVLLLRAASSVLAPFGIDEEGLRRWVLDGVLCELKMPLPPRRLVGRSSTLHLSPDEPCLAPPIFTPFERLYENAAIQPLSSVGVF